MPVMPIACAAAVERFGRCTTTASCATRWVRCSAAASTSDAERRDVDRDTRHVGHDADPARGGHRPGRIARPVGEQPLQVGELEVGRRRPASRTLVWPPRQGEHRRELGPRQHGPGAGGRDDQRSRHDAPGGRRRRLQRGDGHRAADRCERAARPAAARSRRARATITGAAAFRSSTWPTAPGSTEIRSPRRTSCASRWSDATCLATRPSS